MKNTIQESLLEEIEKVLYINEDSLRISHKIYQNDVSPFTLKATAQVEVFYIHNFLNTKNNYVEKLKNMIGGLPQEEAENFLINNPKISNVDIEIQPFFINNISKIPDNIIFRIVEK